MLRLPCCDVCKNRIGEIEDGICKAYPDGIPQEIIDCIEEDKLADCGKGYSFTEKSDYMKMNRILVDFSVNWWMR